jgi:ribonuclease Z
MIIAPALPYKVELIELENDGNGYLEDDNIVISYLPLEHAIPCFGYRVSLKRKPVFNPQKAKQLGIPKALYKTLHAGKKVRLDDGRHIEPEMVLDGAREPISVCYITDTVPKDSMADFARGADLLICEGMYGDEDMHEKMEEKGHMVFSDSARIALEAGVKALWLTHFSPAMKDPETYIENAKGIFLNTTVGNDGMKTTL